MTIREEIQAYCEGKKGPHDRERSWGHCYRYFHELTPEAPAEDLDHAALHLGFYLASWGMYRGRGFLLQHDYTVHLGVIEQLVAPQFSALWKQEFGAGDNDSTLVPLILKAIDAIREAYRLFAPQAESRQASDTLVTKVLLGTFGCLPACDRYFIEGFKSSGFKYSYPDAAFVEQVLRFCRDHVRELREEQDSVERTLGMWYPLMKLVDMYFFQIGSERS